MEESVGGVVVALFSGEHRGRALFGAAGVGDVARPVDGRGESRAPGSEAAVGEFRHGLPVAFVRVFRRLRSRG